ncbi:MAG: hypothetical protein SGJ01_18835 [Gemmatimonadota bacterium]|nr:hypothetical protein [Gemmatimonadota bacterium]
MQVNLRLRLDMAGRAVEFCHTHPDPDTATAPVVIRLTDLVTRAETLSLQQRTSLTVVAAAVSQKIQLRLDIENALAAISGVARAAAVIHPDITVHRRLPRPRTNENTLLTMARVAVAEATAIKDQLAPYGLSDGMLTGLAADVDAYESEIARQRNALAAQVGARADLKGATSDIMKVVKNLDAIHRLRFNRDRELKAACSSARNVAWRNPEPDVPIDPTTPGAVQPNAA